MQVKHIFLGLMLLLLLAVATAAGAAELTLTDFVTRAVKANPRYRISAQDYLVALEKNKADHAIDDWNLIAAGTYAESTPPPVTSFNPDRQTSAVYSLGAEKYFSQTGTALKLEHGNARLDQHYPPFSFGGVSFAPASPYYLSNVSLTIVQPVLKNAFGRITRAGLAMSDLGVELARTKLEQDWQELISQLKDDYFAWQQVHLSVDNYADKVRAVESQLALVKRQSRYGLAEELDLVQMQQKLAAYRIMLEQAKMAVAAQDRRIIQFLGGKWSDPVGGKPQLAIPGTAALAETDAISYLDKQSNARRSADLLVNIQKESLVISEDTEQTDVSLVGRINPNGYSTTFRDSYGQIGQLRDNSLTVTASRPFGNDRAAAAARSARAALTRAEEQRENILLNARIALSALYTSLTYLNEMDKLNSTNLTLAKKRLELEKKKYAQGRSTSFFILQAEDDLVQAENVFNDTRIARAKLVNRIETLTDRHLVDYRALLDPTGTQ